MEKSLLQIDGTDSSSYINLGEELFNHTKLIHHNRDIIILCIGTDRCTGDSLGPLVGDNLLLENVNNFYILGTLENPIHAKNLTYSLRKINLHFKNPYIIAIDAALSNLSNVGKINLKESPLSPGLALNKDLPSVGDLSVTGIVNLSGNFEYLMLQNTRLYTVMLLAKTISKSIIYANELLNNHSKNIIKFPNQ
ncbi:MAG: spore protease YyaC [Clostridium sp.]|uniref:spore protease YyaC n=1 Tax=Clostridium sp. TaxID=1506 RepID=UPI003EE7D14B